LVDTAIAEPPVAVRSVVSGLQVALLQSDSPAKAAMLTAPPAALKGGEKPRDSSVVAPVNTGVVDAALKLDALELGAGASTL
jgi:hypothetical protein